MQEAAQENSSQAGSEGGGEAGGSAAGAGAAVNPGVPLAQFQFQNSFLPESYGGSGYSNQFVVQPVIPITLKPGGFFEYHIVRPTLSILSPVPDPDGPVGDTSGIGDIVALDLYFRKPEEGLVWGIGPIYNLPTSTNRQTGLGEWQIGPAVAYIDSRKKGWVTGFLAQAPFSLESDAYSVTVQPILTKLLKDEWYVGSGDVPLIVAGNNNAYNIPLSVRIGRVIKAGKQPINILYPTSIHSRRFSLRADSRIRRQIKCLLLAAGCPVWLQQRQSSQTMLSRVPRLPTLQVKLRETVVKPLGQQAQGFVGKALSVQSDGLQDGSFNRLASESARLTHRANRFQRFGRSCQISLRTSCDQNFRLSDRWCF